jgi:CPA2 family monovalent cation:H+ antiporter-2
VAFLLVILLLSSAILPSWKALLASALVLVATVILLRRSFTRIYSKAQAALRETLSQPPPTRHPETSTVIPPMMREAKLKTISLVDASAVSGKLIGEIELRKLTGASIVGIEREGENIINPGPDEELKTGDRILLLGNRDQLAAAEKMMVPPTTAVTATSPRA